MWLSTQLVVQQRSLNYWRLSHWPQFYQTRSAWSMDQGSTKKRSAVHNFVSTVTKFCVMWEGLSLPHDTKFGNCRGAIVDRRVIFIWSLIHGSSWSGLIKVGPGCWKAEHDMFSTCPYTLTSAKWIDISKMGRIDVWWNESLKKYSHYVYTLQSNSEFSRLGSS